MQNDYHDKIHLQIVRDLHISEPITFNLPINDSYTQSYSLRLKKKKFCVSKLPPAFVFLCAFDFAKFRLSFFLSWDYFFFFIFTTKNEESLLFWKNSSTWELKKGVKSRLISEYMEVETFQSFLGSHVCGGKGQLK